MPRNKKGSIPRLVVPRNATLRQINAKYRAEFTAADLQEYTEPGLQKGIPVEKLIEELEAIQHTETRKRRKRA